VSLKTCVNSRKQHKGYLTMTNVKTEVNRKDESYSGDHPLWISKEGTVYLKYRDMYTIVASTGGVNSDSVGYQSNDARATPLIPFHGSITIYSEED